MILSSCGLNLIALVFTRDHTIFMCDHKVGLYHVVALIKTFALGLVVLGVNRSFAQLGGRRFIYDSLIACADPLKYDLDLCKLYVSIMSRNYIILIFYTSRL